jgi:hypothetical protein
VLLAAIGVVALALLLLPNLVLAPMIARRVEAAISEKTNARASVGGVYLHVFSGAATVSDVRLVDRGAPAAAAARVVLGGLTVDVKLRSLLGDELILERLAVRGIGVDAVRRKDGTIDIVSLLRREGPAEPPPADEKPTDLGYERVVAERASIEDATVAVLDEASGARVATTGLDLDLGRVVLGRDLALVAPVRAKVRSGLALSGRPGHLSGEVTIAPRPGGRLEAKAHLAARLDPGAPEVLALAGLPPAVRTSGPVELVASAGGTLEDLVWRASADLSEAAVSWEGTLSKPPGAPAALRIGGRLAEGDVTIDETSELRFGPLAAAIRGGTEGDFSRAAISVRAPETDLAALRPMLPALERVEGQLGFSLDARADLAAMRAAPAGASPLAHLVAEGRVRAPRAAFGSFEIGDVDARLTLDRGRARLDAKDFTLWRGRAMLGLGANLAAETPEFDLAADIEGSFASPGALRFASYANPVLGFTDAARSPGTTLSFGGAVTWRGLDPQALAPTLRGEGRFALSGGAVRPGALSGAIAKALPGGGAAVRPIEIRPFEQRFRIDGGKIITPRLDIPAGGDVTLSLSGATALLTGALDHALTVGLPREWLGGDLRDALGRGADAVRPEISFPIGGTVASPRLGAPSLANLGRRLEEGVLEGGIELAREAIEEETGRKLPSLPGLPGLPREEPRK